MGLPSILPHAHNHVATYRSLQRRHVSHQPVFCPAPALRVVDRSSSLFNPRSCPFAHRVRTALKASGAKYEIVEIDFKNKPDWYAININPAGKVKSRFALARG
jgi:hypothetical protein